MATRLAPISVLAALVVCVHAGSGHVEETVTLTGGYTWNGEKGELEAVLIAVSDGSWEVTFDATWDGQPSLWKGTAKGSLSDGEFRGNAHPDGQQGPNFTFSGSFVDGTFKGRYEGPGDGERRETGALTLRYAQGDCREAVDRSGPPMTTGGSRTGGRE
jgi:hypothetical protein